MPTRRVARYLLHVERNQRARRSIAFGAPRSRNQFVTQDSQTAKFPQVSLEPTRDWT